MVSGGKSLLEIWKTQTEAKNSKHHHEFVGRIVDPRISKLYPDIKVDASNNRNNNNQDTPHERIRNRFVLFHIFLFTFLRSPPSLVTPVKTLNSVNLHHRFDTECVLCLNNVC